MFPAPSGVIERLTDHHQVRSSLRLDESTATLPIVDGSVQVDARRDVRRTCDLTILDIDGSLRSIVSPYGVRARILQTITFDDGVSWTVPLGLFVLSSPEFSQEQGGVTVQVSGEDLSRIPARAGRTQPVTVAKTDTLATAILALLRPSLPDIAVASTDGIDPTIGVRLTFLEGPDTNPWKDAVGLAAGFGYDLFFDGNGDLTLRPFPGAQETANPVANLTPGPVTDAALAGGDESVYSGVVAVGWSSTGAPLRAEVWDYDPSSPTYVYGPFGFVPFWFQVDTPTTYDALLKAAKGAFSSVAGASQSLSWNQIPNPGYDVWDVVQVQFPSLGVPLSPVVIDSVTIPLDLGKQQVRARDGRWLP
jgi:hypothetical protein